MSHKPLLERPNPIIPVDTTRLGRLMSELDLTEHELNAIAGLARGQVAQILDRGRATVSTIERIANALHIMDTDLMVLEAVA